MEDLTMNMNKEIKEFDTVLNRLMDKIAAILNK